MLDGGYARHDSGDLVYQRPGHWTRSLFKQLVARLNQNRYNDISGILFDSLRKLDRSAAKTPQGSATFIVGSTLPQRLGTDKFIILDIKALFDGAAVLIRPFGPKIDVDIANLDDESVSLRRLKHQPQGNLESDLTFQLEKVKSEILSLQIRKLGCQKDISKLEMKEQPDLENEQVLKQIRLKQKTMCSLQSAIDFEMERLEEFQFRKSLAGISDTDLRVEEIIQRLIILDRKITTCLARSILDSIIVKAVSIEAKTNYSQQNTGFMKMLNLLETYFNIWVNAKETREYRHQLKRNDAVLNSLNLILRDTMSTLFPADDLANKTIFVHASNQADTEDEQGAINRNSDEAEQSMLKEREGPTVLSSAVLIKDIGHDHNANLGKTADLEKEDEMLRFLQKQLGESYGFIETSNDEVITTQNPELVAEARREAHPDERAGECRSEDETHRQGEAGSQHYSRPQRHISSASTPSRLFSDQPTKTTSHHQNAGFMNSKVAEPFEKPEEVIEHLKSLLEESYDKISTDSPLIRAPSSSTHVSHYGHDDNYESLFSELTDDLQRDINEKELHKAKLKIVRFSAYVEIVGECGWSVGISKLKIDESRKYALRQIERFPRNIPLKYEIVAKTNRAISGLTKRGKWYPDIRTFYNETASWILGRQPKENQSDATHNGHPWQLMSGRRESCPPELYQNYNWILFPRDIVIIGNHSLWNSITDKVQYFVCNSLYNMTIVFSGISRSRESQL